MSATLGESLTSVLSSFELRASALRSLLELRTLGPDAFPSLERTELLLTALEGDVSSVRGAIVSESGLLTEATALMKRATHCTAQLTSISASLPLLPGDMDDTSSSAASRPPLQELGYEAATVNSSAAAPPPPVPAQQPTAAPTPSSRLPAAAPKTPGQRSSRPASARAPPPSMALVTEAELEGAPSYMRSRLDVSKVNQALMEIQKVLVSKYSLLHATAASVRALPEAERKRLAGYKALEGDATKGLFFFSEDDLKLGVPSIKNDATGKNLIAVLRHVGRFKEFKHGGLRCYHTTAPR